MNLGIIIHSCIHNHQAHYNFTPVSASKNTIPHNQRQQTDPESKCVKGASPTFCDRLLSEARKPYFTIILQKAICWSAASAPTWDIFRNAQSHLRPTLWAFAVLLKNIKFCYKGQENKRDGWNSEVMVTNGK